MFRKMCEHSNGWRPEDGVPDLAMMSDITDEGINVNLRTRYKRDQIYTFSGSILIAVNPYKQLDIYNSQWIARYRKQKLDQTDPHVFALAEAMYMNLVMQDYAPSSSTTSPTHQSAPDSSVYLTGGKYEEAMRSTSNNHTAKQQARLRAKNQACVISGESGAGKTETTKFILSYLCSVTPNKSTWMEHQILEANTILEAFGNAKTVRNDNSSRFGKFIQVCFDERNQINGCIIQDYLLEQSRITYQSLEERNYHVFYQLLAAGPTNQELRKKFHLMPPNFYEYLNKTQCYEIEGVDDCAMFDSLRMAMSVLNMKQESCDGLFCVLSAILWLGNLQFQSSDDLDESHAQRKQSIVQQSNPDQCYLTENDQKIIKIVSELLGVEQEKLEPITLRRQINVRGSITEIPFKIYEAKDNRNGMAKALYSKVFSWIVNFINTSINPGRDNTSFLAVLDIFGFENFETNSFEQLCINYANEKLHKFFNNHMFAMEQELYQREGIEFCDINYTDNTPCLELLERPPSCVFRLLSEECRMPKGSDSTFIEKLHTEFSTVKTHPFYIKGNDRRDWSSQFSISHFAGSVTYKVKGFLKKNKDTQQNQLFDMIGLSTNPLLRDLVKYHSSSRPFENFRDETNCLKKEESDFIFPPRAAVDVNKTSNMRVRLQGQLSFCSKSNLSSRALHNEIRRESSFGPDSSSSRCSGAAFTNHSSKTRPTVADAFRYQLTSLVELLNSVNPWYVRCIKPNLEKSATEYDDKQVLLQLKYLGMSDLIRIRREGYPIHFTKHQFVCRYRCLMLKHLRTNPACSPIRLNEENLDNYCKRMITHFELDTADWKIGKTMVLLRAQVYQPMEERRRQLFINMAILIQSSWRSYRECRRYIRMKNAAIRLQDAFRAYRGRLLYLRKRRAILTIQAYVRGMFAREIANALREIKRAELKKERQLAVRMREKEQTERLEEEKLKKTQRDTEPLVLVEDANSAVEVVILEPPIVEVTKLESMVKEKEKQFLEIETGSPASQSNLSSNVSSSTSWSGQENENNETKAKLLNLKDKKEMEELVRVLERHGISLDTSDQNVYADFEKLYDVLGNQLQINGETNSISPSINEDDKCSLNTTGTNCDGDSVSYSGQSQVSSTVTDESTCHEDKKVSSNDDAVEHSSQSARDDTVNLNHDATIHTLNNDKYHSDSIESIASIVSSTSVHSNQQANVNHTEHKLSEANQSQISSDVFMQQVFERQSKTSTFTGNSLLVTGSKMVSNGRPLTRIEEEPLTSSSPSKAPSLKQPETNLRPQSLFPPSEGGELSKEQTKLGLYNENKRRRLERKIVQVKQEKLQQPIIPVTAGLPKKNLNNQTLAQINSEKSNVNNGELINDARKCNIIEYAEQMFNSHLRDIGAGNVMIRTLTRRRRSVDTVGTEYMSKGEMLSYNSSFIIPTSHIKMHDPHNAQMSCSIFKNLCKYMTGESIKHDSEIRIIQSIIRHGIEKSELRDEIYVQVIRQLTNNPSNDYCLRLWVLLGLVSAAFSPSKTFLKHLVSYLQSKPRKDPSITCHAQFCLDNLQAPKLYPRRYPPSPLEVQACKSLTNLKCRIHLLDGRIETISVHPCDTALDALTKLAQKIDLQSIEGWALYESYTTGASRNPHPKFEQRGDFEKSVRLHYYMTDLIASWQDETLKKSGTSISVKMAQKRLDEGNFKITLKKKIFKGAKIKNDPVEISLLYYQAVYNTVIKDNFLVDENLALTLAGLQAQIALGDSANLYTQENQSKKIKTTKISKHSNQIYDVETFICHRLRLQNSSRTTKEWANLISQSHKQFHGSNEVYSKMRYLSMVIYHCPLYGTATFKVLYKGYHTIDQNLMLGVNSEGLVLIRSSDKALINAYRYIDICEDSGITVYVDEHIIQFNVKDHTDSTIKYMSFESNDNEEIAMLMISYYPPLHTNIRGTLSTSNFLIDQSFDTNMQKKRSKLKMTLEDRMRTHQEVQNTRRAIVRTGKLRKPNCEEISSGLFKHTLKRLSANKTKSDKLTRFENIYGTAVKTKLNKIGPYMPQTFSDYNLEGATNNQPVGDVDPNQVPVEVGGATTTTVVDEFTKTYPHRYWAYSRAPLKSSLLIIHDSDLEEAALLNFTAILTYSGLINYQTVIDSSLSSFGSTIDNSSIDSGIASQQSLGIMNGRVSDSSPSSISSSDIYEVCPKKLDERELLKLAQGILDRCLKKDADILKNEFFLQLVKQTTDHPEPNSEINQRHWQLLALACSITYPSDAKILSYLYAHLRRCSLDHVTDEGQYAQFTMRSLQGTLDTRGRRYAPSETEILSTIRCRRVYARVYFLDGEFQAVEFDPCATIAEVVDQIKQRIGLRSDCAGYALFQPLDDECEQVLRPEEKVGDAIAFWETWHKTKQVKLDQQLQPNHPTFNSSVKFGTKASLASLNAIPKNKTHRFIFKKYLFLEQSTDLNDTVERELLYYQTVTYIKEDRFPVLQLEAITLCALKAQIEIGDYTKLSTLPREQGRTVYKQIIMSLMPPHTFNNLPISSIADQHQAFRGLNCADSKKYFFNMIHSIGRVNLPNNPGVVLLHRAHIYDATQTFATAWPSDIWIVIDQNGLHMFVAKSKNMLASCVYRHIVDYNSNNNYLMVILLTSLQSRIKYTFYTKQAQQIAQQMKDYIVIGALSNGTKRRKSVEFHLKGKTPKQLETRTFSNNKLHCS